MITRVIFPLYWSLDNTDFSEDHVSLHSWLDSQVTSIAGGLSSQHCQAQELRPESGGQGPESGLAAGMAQYHSTGELSTRSTALRGTMGYHRGCHGTNCHGAQLPEH